MKAYLLDRLKEASTWRGLILLLSALGIDLQPEFADSIIMVGMGTAGLIGIISQDGGDDMAPNSHCARNSEIEYLDNSVNELKIHIAHIEGSLAIAAKEIVHQSKVIDQIATALTKLEPMMQHMVKVDMTFQQNELRQCTLENKMDEMNGNIEKLRDNFYEEVEQIRNELDNIRVDHHKLAMSVNALNVIIRILTGVMSVGSAALLGAYFQKIL